MKLKRTTALLAAAGIMMSLTGNAYVYADYSENDGEFIWDFAEFTAEISGDNADYADASTPITMYYNGLTLSIEKQSIAGRTDIDKISTAGIHWAGKANGNRYAAYTPAESGTLTVTGSNVGISKSKSGSTLGTSVACDADTTYYIIAPSKAGTASRITYLNDSAGEAVSLLDGADSVTFGFGTDAAQEVNVTDEKYTRSAAYGFTSVDDISVGASAVTAAEDFTFNVLVPNGNYDVVLETTAQTVSYEQIPGISYAKRIKSFDGDDKSFAAAVIDGTLDITIPANESISSVTVIKQAEKAKREKPALFAVGDSTVNTTETNSSHPERGESCTWGVCVDNGYTPLPDEISAFYNCGQAGANTITFYNDYEHENKGHLDDVLLNICPGDYVTVNLGINNKRDKSKTGTADDISDSSAYETIVRDYICGGIMQRGGIPVILTATPHGPIDSYESCYANGVFSCERTGSDARTSTLMSIANKLELDVIDVGACGNSFFNSLTDADAQAAGYSTVLEYVQSMYIDHNHYKAELGVKIAEYVLGSVAAMIDPSSTIAPTAVPNGKYMHISFDDVYSCLKDITNKSYTSIFENSFLADLKRLHESYGAVFTLNCFDAYSKDTSYDISNLPDRYAKEIAENDSWLKFAFHAYDDLTQYTSTETSGRSSRTAEQAAADYAKFKAAVMTASGNNEASIDTVTRLGFFAGDSGCVDVLIEQGITGLLTADDTRISYYFDDALNSTVNQSGTYFDTGKRLKLIKSQTRLESVKNTSSTLEGLKSASGDMLEIFTHEAEYKGNVPARLEAYVKWGSENGYTFGYAMDMDFGHGNDVDITDAAVENNALLSARISRNVRLPYITVFAVSYNENGEPAEILSKRLEPSGAQTDETVSFTDETHENGLAIPQNGKVCVFVWNGAFADNSMDMRPLSENYEIKAE